MTNRFTLPLFPEQASTHAPQVDHLLFFLLALTTFFTLLIGGLIVYFAVKYRRRAGNEVATQIEGSNRLEIAWTVVPLMISLGIYAWGTNVYFRARTAPADALDVYTVGRQWMWKFQHLSGPREINALHVPVGRPVKLTMTSQDVIHSLFVPAFRVKSDVLPGRYTELWFEATKPGTYHLFCAEYCGTMHSGMIGSVTVMEPAAFQEWLAGGAEGSPAAAGEKLFQDLGCATCHNTTAQARCPDLRGLFGHAVTLASGETVTADESYLRESIVAPGAKLVAGYKNIMPTYAGQVSEEGILQLIAYIRSLAAGDEGSTPP
jgi:cytochrome c oxidase subunit 2